jgi:hypothetical protein
MSIFALHSLFNLTEFSNKQEEDYLYDCEEDLILAFKTNQDYLISLVRKNYRKAVIPTKGRILPKNIPLAFEPSRISIVSDKQYDFPIEILPKVLRRLNFLFGPGCNISEFIEYDEKKKPFSYIALTW